MNIQKTLSHLGFQPSDYIISDSDFEMVQKFVEVESEQVDVTPAKPSPEQLQSAWQEVQLKELDIVDLINLYLQDKTELKNENDHINIVNGLIHTWSYANIPQPTKTELLELLPTMIANNNMNRIIEEKGSIGRKLGNDCDTCLEVITGFNDGRLTGTQLQTMLQNFAQINGALSNRMPKSAKTLILQLEADGTIITQEMIDVVLYVLRDYQPA